MVMLEPSCAEEERGDCQRNRNIRDSQHDEQTQTQLMSNSMFVHMAVETFHNFEKRKLQRKKMLGCMYVHRAIHLYTRGEDLNELGMQKEEHDLLIVPVEAARQHAQSLAEKKNHSVGRARLHKDNLRASFADTSARNDVLL